MFLTPEILTLQIVNFIFFFFATIGFLLSVKIFLKWDNSSTTQEQYKLEKQSYLASVIIKYILLFKIPLFIFFIFTLDKLSNIISGAMCAAGIVDATDYGNSLLIIKIINLYLFGFWLILHSKDTQKEDLPYTKYKFGIFLVIYILFLIEIILELIMFKDIDIKQIVLCCGALFSSSSTTYISHLFDIDPLIIVFIFYVNFLLMVLFKTINQKELFSLSNLLFLLSSIASLILFFGTYIYQLPTHHCPFCFLQKEYNYVGYAIYTLLFIGTFNGIVLGFLKENKKTMKNSLLFNLLFVITVSAYPLIYFFKNGVWL
jgi:hypothetical protein